MTDQALLSTVLEVGVESPALQDLYHSGDMEFDREHAHKAEEEGQLQEAVWKHHQKIQDISLDEACLSEARVHQRERSHSVSFINPFYGDQHNDTGGNPYQVQPTICGHEDDEAAEAADQVFQDWNQFQGPAVAPGQFMTIPPHSHPNVLENVYQEIGAQISRRFSMACPVTGGFDMPQSAQLQTQHLRQRSNSTLQFVMEDPSGKENLRDPGLSGIDQERRHSLGAPHLYCCPWTGCNKVFNRFYNLRSHYRIHSGERPYTCNYCDAAFARNHDLKRHERIHLKTKPYVCPTCNKSFSRNDAMNRHVRLNSCARSLN